MPFLFSGKKQTVKVKKGLYWPSRIQRKQAWVNDKDIYKKALQDPLRFWEEQAEQIEWFKKWKRVLTWDPPHARWFEGGKLNISYNCLDRHRALPSRADPPDMAGNGCPTPWTGARGRRGPVAPGRPAPLPATSVAVYGATQTVRRVQVRKGPRPASPDRGQSSDRGPQEGT